MIYKSLTYPLYCHMTLSKGDFLPQCETLFLLIMI